MTRKIVYFTNGYKPDREGVSKELYFLYSYFKKQYPGKVYLHSLSDNWDFSLNKNIISYPDKLIPLGYPFVKILEHSAKINHIYGSLTGRIYLKLISKRPKILTSASSLIEERLEHCAPSWKFIDAIIMESEEDYKRGLQMGIASSKLHLIYPGIIENHIPAMAFEEPFTILFASAPICKDPESLKDRGVELLIRTARLLKDCRFIFLWRGKHTRRLNELLTQIGVNNISIINHVVKDINELQANTHCTILCPEKDGDCKPCPTSLIESLASGRPVLCSDKIGISGLIQRVQCGVVFSPDPDDVVNGIQKLRDNYEFYRKNAETVVGKYFSMEKFICAYEDLYNQMGIQG